MPHHVGFNALIGIAIPMLLFGRPAALSGQTIQSGPYTFITLAGCAGGSRDATGSAAQFDHPFGLAVDGWGNIYVADSHNHTIRKVTTAGVVTTIAGLAGSPGNVDGEGGAALFSDPQAVAVDVAGNLYVADKGNNAIRKISAAAEVTTLAVLPAAPEAVALDAQGNVYVAEISDGTVREITAAGVVITLAQLNGNPSGIAVDNEGNLYVADVSNSTIYKITAAGVVTTIAGVAGIPGGSGGIHSPWGVAVDSEGNVFVANAGAATVSKITTAGVVTTVAEGSTAHLRVPTGVAVDTMGNIYVADNENNTIGQITPAGWVLTLAGQGRSFGSADGVVSVARFSIPSAVVVDSTAIVYVADTYNHTIRKVTPAGVVTTLAGLAGNSGSADGAGSAARFSLPQGVAADGAGNLYVADTYNHTIRQVTPARVVTTLAGLAGVGGNADGTGPEARFYYPEGVAVDSAGNLYVADSLNYTIRKMTPGRVVTTLAGLAGNAGTQDGSGSAARFRGPTGVAVDGAGNVYVTDTSSATIRKVTPAGLVTTVAGWPNQTGSADGAGNAARFYNPEGIAVDGAGNIFVADSENNTIRLVTPAGIVTTVAGLAGTSGRADASGSAARFANPFGLALDNAGNIYVGDSRNNVVRKGIPSDSVTPPVLLPPSVAHGQCTLGITGLGGLPVFIESSDQARRWEVVAACVLESGTNSFVDPAKPDGVRFYRARTR